MIRYRADSTLNAVVKVDCVPVGYPHKDADGETQFLNTHFDDEAQAWATLLRECEARVENVASARTEARRTFDKATTKLADAAEALVAAKESHQDYLQRVREAAEGAL